MDVRRGPRNQGRFWRAGLQTPAREETVHLKIKCLYTSGPKDSLKASLGEIPGIRRLLPTALF